ncbi:hypothetical protein SAMN05421780_1271 [Flexibacter flexilis DSM 6793]|uniref:Uncharacterized protein n=1 Tax=Flexibacter flexilis DSM 6793 TaxID=927664 RepID=A0A1I1P6J3_9BACT|nr:hypothetical protein SAMN05421780_1271 [Flexibacter flexilis DSM 6793]
MHSSAYISTKTSMNKNPTPNPSPLGRGIKKDALNKKDAPMKKTHAKKTRIEIRVYGEIIMCQ